MKTTDLEKLVQTRIEFLASHPEQINTDELLKLIECARNINNSNVRN